MINGKEFKKLLVNEEKALVYLWGPNCNSDVCISLNLLQSYCHENSTTLFIVAEYYDVAKMELSYDIENPILGIDTEFYKTNKTNKYLELFFRDVDSSIKNFNNRYFLFENGELSVNEESIKQIF